MSRASAHRQREIVDLRTGVVIVELARHIGALPLDQARDRVAERRLAAVADVQGAGRIRGDELDEHALAGARLASSVAILLVEDRRHDLLARCMRKLQVDETGTGDVGRLNDAGQRGFERLRERLRELARIAAHALGERQCNVRRVIAMRRVARAFDDRG